MSHRVKYLVPKFAKQEQELHIITNPFADAQSRLIDDDDDYQAPLTSHTLRPNSKWNIVRHNIHKIRSWGGINLDHVHPQLRYLYLYWQVRRELQRAQNSIEQIERSHYTPIDYFNLPTDETHNRRYNVSHLQPSNAIYHPAFQSQPVVLQALLYYFSKECVVPYNSVFRPFLSDVCSILYQDRQRINRAAVFRKVATIITIVISIFLALMFFSLIVSVFTTTSNLRAMYRDDPDGGIEWRQSATTVETTLKFYKIVK
ncbi:unnamed protein product [Adineta steineri]|uniref:Uncharacterized protein n=1 Tax=Adineta steineri TaxID=433720 RepID=A0A813N1Q3_9BILA|nr:unnamed protein product [Adineta steineri]CAF1335164.1 unnamed protein product [Adineta steineri]CAF1337162.1 unnamed protein product [Adineta steineri]